MDLRQLKYFCAIVEAGSLSAAARQLPIAQPTLTVAMSNLEKELGTALLVRNALGVTTTEAGQYLYTEAHRILRDLANTGEHVHALAEGRAGHLSLSVTPAYSWAHLTEVLQVLSVAAPGVQVQLRDPPPLEILEQVKVGASDVGIVATYDLALLQGRYGERLRFHPLGELPIVAALPLFYPASAETISLDDLRNEVWIVPETSRRFPGMAAFAEQLWHDRGWTPRHVREVSTSQTGLPMIAGGLGVALMPSSLAALAAGSVALRPVREQLPSLVAVATWQRDRALTPPTRRLLDALGEVHGTTTP